MQWPIEIWRKLSFLFRKSQFDRELDEEMRFHLEMKARRNREAGMDDGAARLAAQRQFGSAALASESSREAWGWRWCDALVQDLCFAARLMRGNAFVTTLAVLTLALAIGANTVVFSLVEATVLRPLPYPDPARLFMLWTVEAQSGRAMNSSYPDFHDWQQRSRSFETMAAFRGGSVNLTGGFDPERVDCVHTTPALFEVLGTRPILGRGFSAGDQDRRVVLLDHRVWTRRFARDPGVVGRTMQLDGRAYTVIGVLGPDFRFVPRHFVGDPELFVLLDHQTDRTNWSLRVIGRLRPGVSSRQAQLEMDWIARDLTQSGAQRLGISLESLGQYAAAYTKHVAFLLLGAVAFVLLIACANVANLLLGRGAARQREIGVRIALGASRARLMRQLLTESVLLAGLGAVLGAALAHVGLPILISLAPERTALFELLRDNGVHWNRLVLTFTAAVAVMTAVAFGAAPALKVTQPSNSSARGVRRGHLPGGLIAMEVALSFVLLAGAGLLTKSLARLLAVDLGMRTERLLTMYTDLPASKYPEPQWQTAFFQNVLSRVRSLPGVLSVAGVVDLPLTRAYSVNSFEIEGQPAKARRAAFHSISTDYFQTMGIPLLRGRDFTALDTESASDVAIVNRTMAQRFWPGADPIGGAVLISRAVRETSPQGIRLRFVKRRVEIVGVAGDVRQRGLDRDPPAELFLPFPQRPTSEMTLVIRAAGDPSALIPPVRKEIWRIDPDQPITDVKTMDDWVSIDIAPRRFMLLLIGSFAAVSVLLAAAGIYGVISYSVVQRTREIGIRMALGGQRQAVIWWVLRGNLGWLAVGLGVGTAGALGMTRLLKAYLFDVTPTDSAVFILVALTLVSVALSANLLPARQAAKIDPMKALRHE